MEGAVVAQRHCHPVYRTASPAAGDIAFVTEPLRGHDLGAWLVAETTHRMLPTGIVLMWP
nr:hypothetical protein GCM10017611_03780 [Rhodococcus wratislaviensis]